MKKKLLFSCCCLALLLTACGGSSRSVPTSTPTQTATPTATPTEKPDPLLMALATSMLEQQNAKTEKERAEAAAIVAEITLEWKQHQDNIQLTKESFAVTVAAGYAAATETAKPTQTPIPTETPIPPLQTATAVGAYSYATVETGNAELIALSVDRQAKKNSLDAYSPWALVWASFFVGGVTVFVYSRWRQLKRDRNGMIGVEAVKHKNGVTYVKPDLMTAPAMTVNQNGQITEAGSESEFQQQTTRRQQLVEAAKGKTMPEFRQLIGLMGQAAPASGGINYFDANRFMAGVLGDAEEDLIDGEVTDVK